MTCRYQSRSPPQPGNSPVRGAHRWGGVVRTADPTKYGENERCPQYPPILLFQMGQIIINQCISDKPISSSYFHSTPFHSIPFTNIQFLKGFLPHLLVTCCFFANQKPNWATRPLRLADWEPFGPRGKALLFGG